MENPIKMDDLGVPLFSETSMSAENRPYTAYPGTELASGGPLTTPSQATADFLQDPLMNAKCKSNEKDFTFGLS